MTTVEAIAPARDYTLRVATGRDQVEEMRRAWKQLGRVPNSDIDFFLCVVEQRAEILHPYVVLISQGDEPKAMAVGRIDEGVLELGIGYKTLWKPRLRTLTIVHGGLLGDVSGFIAELLFKALLEPLNSGAVDALRLSFIPVDSEILRLARRVGFFSRDRAIQHQAHWKMGLKGTIDEVYAGLSRDHRQQLKRKARSFEKAFPDALTVRCFKEPSELPQMVPDVEAIAKKTYQRGLSAGFIDNEENRKRVRIEAELGWLRMYVLYVGGRPSTYWWGAVYDGIFHSFALGFDPEDGQYSPGSYLMTRVLEDLCPAGVKAIDFGLGDARYKRQFGTEQWEEATAYVFAPKVRTSCLNLCRTLNAMVVAVIKRVLEKFEGIEKIKKRWRQKLRPEKTDNAAPQG